MKCPKRKVCVENMQGLPLCTCPNAYICRGRKRQVCGADGNTYKSKCHMRVTSCTKGKRIRLKHKGACSTGMIGTQGNIKYPEGEYDIRRRRRKNRRKEKRKHRKEERRRRKRRQRKRAYLKGRKQKVWRYDKKSANKLTRRHKRRKNRHIGRVGKIGNKI